MNKSILLLTFVLIPAGFAAAQKNANTEGPVGIFSSRAEYDQFIGGAKQAAYGEGGTPEMRAMIPMLNDIALAKPMGWTNQTYGGAGSSIDILSNPEVRKDLEMVDDQYRELQNLHTQIQNRTAEQLRSLDFGNRDTIVQQIKDIRERSESDLRSLLLPHQLERLRQLQLQTQLRRRSLVDIITSDPAKTELKITNEQARQLRDEERQIEQDLEKEIAKLRSKARERLLSKLNRQQKSEVEQMIGDSFDFEVPRRKNVKNDKK